MTGESSKEVKRRIRNPSPSSEAAFKRMKAAKPRDTAPEKALRSALHKKGLRFRIDVKPIKELNRKADVVFRSAKVAVFVDGCFWHGCPIHGTQAKANAEFWEQKIKQNQERDTDTTRQLKAAGWRVIRVWEHEDPERAALKIYNIVVKRKRR
ncbi:MAG TPA: very short patch repair endonuclease [Desulfobacteria bacterium]|nr:very short patch repair endonuclease [Desulfobacteria bacterium]